MKNLCLSLCVLLCCSLAANAADDILIAEFEAATYAGWDVEGTAFGSGPVRGVLAGQLDVEGFRGRGLVNSFRGGDKAVGTITSPPFDISQKYLAFLIGGGRYPNETGVELLVDGKSVRTATGANSEILRWHTWDVAELVGKQARLQIFDRATGGWGHINVDHVILTDRKRHGAGTLRLEEYRKSPEYYREPYRPQFHFTPELNWMNDPNGLVYFDGEYHLFYQHNPHGNRWGHMSWGHAVSDDLIHWQHLSIALHEEYGVMIFSGSAVVDWNNTSGLGKSGRPPLVAIYTGHGHGEQTQDIAYSNDRGRTWTKYTGNPVIDIDNADFRDPKVFWHEPTRRWIMVVSLAKQKRVQFYGSPDLKKWTHLSDFGPAGVAGKPNWECPDLFELPIENEPGKTGWVMEVDMGSGAIAGGSGGEYFVGTFDGTNFKCDHDVGKSQWVDYGCDFYAPVSWSDIPPEDGRRIWIGWMNNWETNLLPTFPWRSAMSIPRTLSLRRVGDRLRMIQRPVHELRRLRGERVVLADVVLQSASTSLSEKGISGGQFEIIVEFELGDAEQFGLRVREGDQQQTVVGYDVEKQQLFVDRTQSGEDDFHEKFAGRHTASVPPKKGRVSLHLFVDTSSIEVFAADGAVVITDRIFPDAASQGISAYATGGTATIRSLEFWPLSSVWSQRQR